MIRMEITDQRFENSIKMVLVKTTDENIITEKWEKFDTSIHEKLIMEHYKKLANIGNNVKRDIFEIFADVPESVFENLTESFRTSRGLVIPQSELLKLNLFALPGSFSLFDEKSTRELTELRRKILVSKQVRRRSEQLKCLNDVQKSFNDESEERIYLENNFDLKIFPCPTSFRYINTWYVMCNSDVETTLKSLSKAPGCRCTDCSKSKDCCFNRKLSLLYMAYDSNRKLRRVPKAKRGMVIYECNKNCSCNEYCPNKVVQKKTNVEFRLFNTANNCGYGVRTKNDITKGTFVGRYAGELILKAEIESRSLKLSKNFSPYIFGLDCKKRDKYPDFGIDALHCGNITRFFNHSCDPNLCTLCVYVDYDDERLYHIAFFATRFINAGEQLCIDYGNEYEMDCKCGTKNCVKYEKKDSSTNNTDRYSIRKSFPFS